MTARYNTLTVVLDHDIREDDAESLIAAIRHIRGVLDVTGNESRSYEQCAAESRVRSELFEKIRDVIYPSKTRG